MSWIDSQLFGYLVQGFLFYLGVSFNEWLFKRRMDKALDKLERSIKQAVKNGKAHKKRR